MNVIYTGKIRVCPIDYMSIPGFGHLPTYLLIEGTENVKIYIEDKEEIKQVSTSHFFGRLLFSVDFDADLNSRHYVVLTDNCLYDISDWPAKTLIELVNCRDYARSSTNIDHLRTFLEL